MSIHLTPAQAAALAELTAEVGDVALHQLEHGGSAPATGDVYATPQKATAGFRIDPAGGVGPIPETLPGD